MHAVARHVGKEDGLVVVGRQDDGAAVFAVRLKTVVDPALPPPPKNKRGGDTFPAPPYHKIAVMGVALLDAFYRLRNIWCVGEKHDEFFALTSLLAFLNAKLAAGVEVTMVSWNGRGEFKQTPALAQGECPVGIMRPRRRVLVRHAAPLE